MKNIYIRSLFLGIVVVLVSITLLTYNNLINYIDEVSLIRHSNIVLETVEDVLTLVKDAEIGHRGYQLTRDSAYLNPYFTSVEELPGQIAKLDSLLSYNTRQSRKADTLNLLIENQFAIISQILSNAGRSSLYMDQYESHLLARGKDNMSEIRSLVGRIVEQEETTFNDRVSRETVYRNIAPVALLVYTLIALSGMTFLFIRIIEALNKRKIAEDKLKENLGALQREASKREFAQKTLRNVVDNSLDGIMAFRSVRNGKGVEDFEWIMANAVSSEVTGQPGGQLVGKRLLDILPESKKEGLFDQYMEVIESGQARQFERSFEKEGVITWYNVTIVKLEDGFITTFSNITKQKQAERDMLIAERLSMTGKIAQTIAHEVRNPLTSLNLALEQLKDEMPRDNESLTSYTEVIERSAGRIEQLIGEMLNSSKPKELDLELTNIEEVIEGAISLTIDRINLNQIRLEKRYNGNLPRVLLDKDKMIIAILNIVINAVEAMEPGRGNLVVETAAREGFVVVSVSDNGKGIAVSDIDKLFDPFYTAKQGGMGLGLTTTKNILSSHSATVEVKSSPGVGTCFSIFFKLAEY